MKYMYMYLRIYTRLLSLAENIANLPVMVLAIVLYFCALN